MWSSAEAGVTLQPPFSATRAIRARGDSKSRKVLRIVARFDGRHRFQVGRGRAQPCLLSATAAAKTVRGETSLREPLSAGMSSSRFRSVKLTRHGNQDADGSAPHPPLSSTLASARFRSLKFH